MVMKKPWKKFIDTGKDQNVIDMRLDVKSRFPSGMEEYLQFNGWHFNKKMCEWATSRMYKSNKEYITPYSLQDVEALLKKNNITFPIDYDAVYVANMCKADFLGSSIADEIHLIKFIKDYVQDPDSYDGMPFTRFYADCIGSGVSIPWEDCL